MFNYSMDPLWQSVGFILQKILSTELKEFHFTQQVKSIERCKQQNFGLWAEQWKLFQICFGNLRTTSTHLLAQVNSRCRTDQNVQLLDCNRLHRWMGENSALRRTSHLSKLTPFTFYLWQHTKNNIVIRINQRYKRTELENQYGNRINFNKEIRRANAA